MMETLGMGIMGEKSFYDVPEHDLLGVWDSDIGTNVHDSLRVSSSMIDGNSHDTLWNSGLFDSQPGVIRNDKLLTDSVMSPLLLPSASSTCSSTSSSAATSPSSFLQPPTFTSVQTNNPPVKTEHSYSMIGGAGTAGSDGDSIPDSPLSNTDDMESECYPCIPMNSEAVTSVPSAASMSPSSSISSMTGVVKLEPMSPDEESDTGYFSNELFRNSVNYVIKEELSSPKSANKAKTNPNLLRSSHNQPTLLVSRGANKNAVSNRLVFPKVNLKVEPYSPGSSNNATTCTMSPPSTPLPSSEQGRSPVTVTAASAVTQPSTTNMFKGPMAATNTTKVVFGHPTTSSRHPIQTSLISNQPKGATGMLHLTEEEKRTLISEGYPVPQRLPLTKSEEKSLKKIRRKIKNKISAQESRRKKKEYMDCLERRMQGLNREMEAYKQKCGSLESQNASLLVQVQKLQAQLAGNKSTDQSR